VEFADTVDWRNSEHPKEYLKTYENLVEWSRGKGILNEEEAKRLTKLVRAQPDLESAVMNEAIDLRNVIYRLLSAAAHRRNPERTDIEGLNRYLAKGLAHARISVSGKKFEWGWNDEDRPADAVLWPIARSAAELLTSNDLGRLKECANEQDGCGWLFLDTTRNQSRRWCTMDSCGNRTKARKFYDRHERSKAV